jgi:hypothetical protein
MYGELRLWNIMLVIVIGIWLGSLVNASTSRSGASLRLPVSIQAARSEAARSLDTTAVTSEPQFTASAAACPSGEITVFEAAGLSGRQPLIPDDGPQYCVVAGPLPGGLVAAGGYCYSLNGSLVCNNVLDANGFRWVCPAVAGAVPAWPSRCVPGVKNAYTHLSRQ